MKEIIISGAGGQGVMSLGKFIAYAAIEEGMNVSCIPSYGPEMRGGTANCSIVYGSSEIASPVIEKPDILVALNRPSFDRFHLSVKSSGNIITDADLYDADADADAGVLSLHLSDAAEKSGSRKSVNLIVLGVLTKLCRDFSLSSVINAVKRVFRSKPNLIDGCIKALRVGYGLV